MSEYGDDIILSANWTDERWELRREQMAEVWPHRSEEQKKKIIALLVAHAPQRCTETDLSVADRKI